MATKANELVDALVQTSFMTMAVLSRVAAEHDLSLTQLRVLAILRDRRVKMTTLADYLGLEKSTLSGLVDRAEKRGLVQRLPHSTDGRGFDVVLGKEGAKLEERLTRAVADALGPLTSELGASDRDRLTTLLVKMLAAREP